MDGFFQPDLERIEDFATHLDFTGDRALGLKPVLEEVTDKILARERRMFETGGASSGVLWAPLRKSTIERKKGYPFPRRPLWRSGELMASLSERGARYQHLDVDDEHIELETTHPAAPYHAEGYGVPRRPPLIIPKKHADEYVRMINDFIFGES